MDPRSYFTREGLRLVLVGKSREHVLATLGKPAFTCSAEIIKPHWFSGNPVRTAKYLHEWRYENICKDPVAQNRDPITRVIFNHSWRVVEIENQ